MRVWKSVTLNKNLTGRIKKKTERVKQNYSARVRIFSCVSPRVFNKIQLRFYENSANNIRFIVQSYRYKRKKLKKNNYICDSYDFLWNTVLYRCIENTSSPKSLRTHKIPAIIFHQFISFRILTHKINRNFTKKKSCLNKNIRNVSKFTNA